MKKNKLTILTVALLTTLVSCGDVVSSDNSNNDGLIELWPVILLT